MNNLSLEQLKLELEKCHSLWSVYPYECLAFEISYLQKAINNYFN